jgi:hypothetical protein
MPAGGRFWPRFIRPAVRSRGWAVATLPCARCAARSDRDGAAGGLRRELGLRPQTARRIPAGPPPAALRKHRPLRGLARHHYAWRSRVGSTGKTVVGGSEATSQAAGRREGSPAPGRAGEFSRRYCRARRRARRDPHHRDRSPRAGRQTGPSTGFRVMTGSSHERQWREVVSRPREGPRRISRACGGEDLRRRPEARSCWARGSRWTSCPRSTAPSARRRRAGRSAARNSPAARRGRDVIPEAMKGSAPSSTW